MLNKIKAEVHSTGIGDQDGTQIIHYNETDPGFGIYSKGKKVLKLKSKMLQTLLGKAAQT